MGGMWGRIPTSNLQFLTSSNERCDNMLELENMQERLSFIDEIFNKVGDSL